MIPLVPAVPPENLHLHRTAVKHGDRLTRLEELMKKVIVTQDEHSAILAEHSSDLRIIKATLIEHSRRLDAIERRLDSLEATMNAGFAKMFRLLGG